MTTVQGTPKTKLDPIWVKPSSSVPGLGGLIANALSEHDEVILRAIGAGAVNQGYKATVRARQLILARGDDLFIVPSMKEVQGDKGDTVVAVMMSCRLASELSL